jgi:hypothetical protein
LIAILTSTVGLTFAQEKRINVPATRTYEYEPKPDGDEFVVFNPAKAPNQWLDSEKGGSTRNHWGFDHRTKDVFTHHRKLSQQPACPILRSPFVNTAGAVKLRRAFCVVWIKIA